MPVSGGWWTRSRLLALGAIAAAALAALVLIRDGEPAYEVTVAFENAGQLVNGNEVKVDGIPSGSVEEIELGPANQALVRLSLDRRLAPLHEGTRAEIRSHGLASVAGRSVHLHPGPEGGREIPHGGRIEAHDADSIVDLDAVLAAFDPETRRAVRHTLRAMGESLEDGGEALRAAINSLDPALSQARGTVVEVLRDRAALEAMVTETADVVTTLAERRDDLAGGTEAAGLAAEAIASEREGLSRTIERLPETMRHANTTFVDLRATLDEVRPAIAEARPVARRLARVLPAARPVARDLRRVVPPLRRLVRRPGARNDVIDLLRGLPPLAREGTPTIRDLVRTLREARPIVSELRPYLPDLVGGLSAGFGGNAGGYYDANGHFTRISLIGGPFSVNNSGNLVPLPTEEMGTGFQRGLVRRCPGSAIYPAPDGSNQFLDEGQLSCDPAIQRDRP